MTNFDFLKNEKKLRSPGTTIPVIRAEHESKTRSTMLPNNFPSQILTTSFALKSQKDISICFS